MAGLTPDEQQQIDAYVREHGVKRLAQVQQFAALQMTPMGHAGRGRSSKFSRGRQTFYDAVSLVDRELLPDVGDAD
jgi:hypothetical protein